MLQPGEANLAPPWSTPPITLGESDAKGGGIWGSSCTEICIAIAIATRSHFPLPPVQNVENVDEIMLRFEGREKEQALAETRLYRGEGSPMPHSESERDRALPPVAAG